MSSFFSGVGVILSLELRQRVRGVAWYVLLGIFVGLVAIVTVLLSIAFSGMPDNTIRGATFSTIIYFVLLLGTLVTPALSGNAINGDREAGTLATTQVTLITTWQLILGKFFAAWVTALAFLAAAVPFLVFSAIAGGMDLTIILVSVLVLAIELGVVAAIGVGLSGILNRALFSIVTTYLVVAVLSIGTVIAFALGGAVDRITVTTTYNNATTFSESGVGTDCGPTQVDTYQAPRYDHFWGVLVANPYVVLADAVPTEFSPEGYPTDLFGNLKFGLRSAQIPPDTTVGYDACAPLTNEPPQRVPEEIIASTVPGWFVGLIIQVILAAGALVAAWARTRTPTGRLGKGNRIA
jgi:ABC-type transport system involved in multi-copper enzyme maturation permease subunit